MVRLYDATGLGDLVRIILGLRVEDVLKLP